MDFSIGQIGLLLVPALAAVFARLFVAGVSALNRKGGANPHAEIDVKVMTPEGVASEFRRDLSLPLSDESRKGVLAEINRRLTV